MKPEIEQQPEYDDVYLLEKEKEAFGFYLSSHPTTMFKKDNPTCIPVIDIDKNYDKTIDTLVLIEKVKAINTKKGDKMAFLTGTDETGSKEFILFPKVLQGIEELEKGKVVKVRGKVEKRLNEIQVIVEKIKYVQGEQNES